LQRILLFLEYHVKILETQVNHFFIVYKVYIFVAKEVRRLTSLN
jgi:hypothetical protein